MRRLTACTAPGSVEWLEVPELAGPTRAGAFALGHEAVAEVVSTGDSIDLRAGDLVLPDALLREVTALVADGRLRPGLVTTRVLDWEDAPAHFTEPTVKLVVVRSSSRASPER